MNTSAIENILRKAPQPAAPPGLKARLYAQARGNNVSRLATESSSNGWFRRWWPALAPAAISLACATLFTLQQSEVRDLKSAIRTSALAANPSAPPTHAESQPVTVQTPGAQEEIQRLKAVAAQLRNEVTQLEQLRAQNDQLRKQLAAGSAMVLSPEETKAVEDARARALSIQCVNNLKQLGLAVKMFSLDNKEHTPPNLLGLSNYVGSFMKVFVCPADTARQAANDPGSFTPANCSYEYLAPSTPDIEPNRVLFRC